MARTHSEGSACIRLVRSGGWVTARGGSPPVRLPGPSRQTGVSSAELLGVRTTICGGSLWWEVKSPQMASFAGLKLVKMWQTAC